MNQLMLPEGQSLIKLNAEGREQFAFTVVDQVLEGNADALEVLQSMKSWEEVFKLIKKNEKFDDAAKEAIGKYGKTAELNGHKLTTGEAGVEFDYSKCGDPVLVKLQEEFEQAQAALKERQKWIRKVPAKGVPVLDPESGEVTTVYPPARTSTTVIKITLKK